MKNKLKIQSIRPAPVILSLLVMTAAAILSLFTPFSNASFIFLGVYIALAAAGTVLFFKAAARQRSMSIKDIEALIEEQRKLADKDLESYAASVASELRFYYLYLLLYSVCAFGMVLFLNSTGSFFGIICMIIAYFTFLLIFDILLPLKPAKLDCVLPRDEYPELYETVERALSNNRNKVSVCCTGGNFLGTAYEGKVLAANIGAYDYSIMNSCELQAILEHEKCYLDPGEYCGSAVLVKNQLRTAEQLSPMVKLISGIMVYPEYRAGIILSLANIAAARAVEKRVLEKLASNGLGGAYASGMTKLRMLYFFDTYELEDHVKYFESEEQRNDLVRGEDKAFRTCFAKKRDIWMQLLTHELSDRNERTFCYSETLQILGQPVPEIRLDAGNTEEQKRLLEYADGLVIKNTADKYKSDRENHYLKPLSVIEQYEKEKSEGKQHTPLELRPVLDALEALSRIDELMELCRYVIETAGTANETAHAHYMLGTSQLFRLDKAGFENILYAMDLNSNYVREGAENVSQFARFLCSESELAFYTERVSAITQRAADRNTLAPNDINTAHGLEADTDIPEAQMLENLDFIVKTYGEALVRVWQIRRPLSEDFYSTDYILDLKTDDEEALKEADRKLFYFLDCQQRHYSFCYLNECSFDPDKIPDACIYNAKE